MSFIEIREQGPLKQGLKLGIGINIIKLFFIREQGPLKQGLKQCINLATKWGFTDS